MAIGESAINLVDFVENRLKIVKCSDSKSYDYCPFNDTDELPKSHRTIHSANHPVVFLRNLLNMFKCCFFFWIHPTTIAN